MDDNHYTPIQCHIFDYIEIACLRGYELDIILLDGILITGKALTTQIENKQEWLVLQLANLEAPTNEQRIRLDTIKSILPLDQHAEFGRIDLS